jgi:hypothetical protein
MMELCIVMPNSVTNPTKSFVRLLIRVTLMKEGGAGFQISRRALIMERGREGPRERQS